jgi:hypothetical protein
MLPLLLVVMVVGVSLPLIAACTSCVQHAACCEQARSTSLRRLACGAWLHAAPRLDHMASIIPDSVLCLSSSALWWSAGYDGPMPAVNTALDPAAPRPPLAVGHKASRAGGGSL